MGKYYQRIVLLLVALCGTLLTVAQPVLQWKADYKDAAFEGFNPTHIQVDSQGNVIVTGAALREGTSRYITVKHNKNGKRLWTTTTGPFNGSEGVGNLWVSPSGSIYIGGASALVKLDASGKELWRRGGGEFVTDAFSNVYLKAEGKVTKYDSAGNRVWDITEPQTQPFEKMAAGKQGDLFFISGDQLSMYNKEGLKRWEQIIVDESNYYDKIEDFVIDELGNTYTISTRDLPEDYMIPYDHNPIWDNIHLTKFSTNGERVWELAPQISDNIFSGPTLQFDNAQTLVLDANDFILVYDTSGKQRWRGDYPNFPASSSKAAAAVNKKGELFLIQYAFYSNGGGLVVNKFNFDGDRRWTLYDLAFENAIKIRSFDSSTFYLLSNTNNSSSIYKFKDQENFAPITFSLIDAIKDTVIKNLRDGDTIFQARNPHLNIQAHTHDTVSKSVRLSLRGGFLGTETREVLENNAPYSLFGNRGSNFYSWTPKEHEYRLSAASFTGKKGTGSESFTTSIGFYVLFPEIDELYFLDPRNVEYLESIYDGATYYKNQLPEKVSIFAGTYPDFYVESVRMVLNNRSIVENHEPFTFPANNRGFEILPGQYTLTAIPYSQDSAKGYRYKPLTVRFTVVDDTAPTTITSNNKTPELAPAKASITAIPNPFSSQAAITFTAAANGYTTLRAYDMSGVLVRQLFAGNAEKGRPYTLTMNKGNLTSGMYTLQLVTGNYTTVQKVVLNP